MPERTAETAARSHRAHHTHHRSHRPAKRKRRARTVRTILWTAVTLAALGAAYPQLRHLPETARSVHFEAVRDGVARWGPWAPIAAFLLIVVHLFIPLPGEIVLAVMGALFGFWRGFAISWTGDVVGAIIAFEMGRALGPNRRPRTMPAKALKWVDQHIQRDDWRTALVIRFIPLFPVSVFNFALGRTSVSWLTYLWTTALGFMPMTAAVVAVGYGATGGGSVLPWAMGALAAMLTAGLVYRYRIARLPPGS